MAFEKYKTVTIREGRNGQIMALVEIPVEETP